MIGYFFGGAKASCISSVEGDVPRTTSKSIRSRAASYVTGVPRYGQDTLKFSSSSVALTTYISRF